jgi:hypothetical protein
MAAQRIQPIIREQGTSPKEFVRITDETSLTQSTHQIAASARVSFGDNRHSEIHCGLPLCADTVEKLDKNGSLLFC